LIRHIKVYTRVKRERKLRSGVISRLNTNIGGWGFVSGYMVCTVAGFCLSWSVTVQAEITLDGSLGQAGALNGPDYQIPAEVGRQLGSNLFHSFGQFSLTKSESATFSGPSAIDNVIGRVTGGEASSIDGLIRSTIPGADLFLLNPAGILFGPNASLDVQGSFHASTADYIGFKDGQRFAAVPSPQDALLTTAAPETFGFLGDNPESIFVNQSALEVPEGKTLSLIGGDIEIKGNEGEGPNGLRAPSGQINVASVASAGEVIPNAPGQRPDLRVTSELKGDVRINEGGILNAGGAGGGTVLIRGGTFVADNGSVFASATGPTDGSLNDVPGAGIDIEVATDVVLDNRAVIGTNVLHGVAQDSAGVHIDSEHVEIRNNAEIQSVALGAQELDDGTIPPASSGNAGDIAISSDSVSISNEGQIRSNTGGSGSGGRILIQTESLEVKDGGLILTLAFGGASADAGDIDVDAKHVELSAAPPFPFTAITSQTVDETTTGAAGTVDVNAETLKLFGSAFISSLTFNEGRGGNVNVAARDIFLSGSPDLFTMGIFANTLGKGRGGQLNLTAENLELKTRSSLQARTLGPGDAGGATIDVSGTLILREASFINTGSNFGTGNGADLQIFANDIVIAGVRDSGDPAGSGRDFTGLSTATNAGRGGNVFIEAAGLELTNTGRIITNSEGGGEAGDISINVVDDVSVTKGAGITAFADGAGDGGDINVKANRLVVSGHNAASVVDPETGDSKLVVSISTVNTQTQGETANAGDITIDVESLEILDGANIRARTLGKGDAGNINVLANRVLVSGNNAFLGEFFGNPVAGHSQINTSVEGVLLGLAATGSAGDIRIGARDVRVLDSAEILSGTTTPGAGGAIEIIADTITVSGDGRIRTVSETTRPEAGSAGDILIMARQSYRSDGGIVSSAAGGAGLEAKARGGSVIISAGKIAMSNSAFISARNNGGGDAGSVTLKVDGTFHNDGSTVTVTAKQGKGGDLSITTGRDIQLTNGAEVSAQTSGSGDAGDLRFTSNNVILVDGSKVTTEASKADGGNITLKAPDLIHLNDSEITSSVGGGRTTVGGNINIDPEFVVLNGSEIRANAFEGKGGNIRIVADQFIASPDSRVTASSALGIDGQVEISSPETDIAAGLQALPASFLDATRVMTTPCAQRSGADVIRLVVRQYEVLPDSPYALRSHLPSPKRTTGTAAKVGALPSISICNDDG
jgi:filamentous hemagglutinin family protein